MKNIINEMKLTIILFKIIYIFTKKKGLLIIFYIKKICV